MERQLACLLNLDFPHKGPPKRHRAQIRNAPVDEQTQLLDRRNTRTEAARRAIQGLTRRVGFDNPLATWRVEHASSKMDSRALGCRVDDACFARSRLR